MMHYPVPSSLQGDYHTFVQTMELRGLQPATVESYSLGLRQVASAFDGQINDLSKAQLRDYFHSRLKSHSQSSVNITHSALGFYYRHVLHKTYPGRGLVKRPRVQRIPDVLSTEQVQQVLNATEVPAYRVFFFTLYSLGLRISEGLRLQVGDIDSAAMRVHIRNAKGNKDRLVPLPPVTLSLLRDYWRTHRNEHLLFPRRSKSPRLRRLDDQPMDTSGIVKALRRVSAACGIKKRSAPTVFATATPRI